MSDIMIAVDLSKLFRNPDQDRSLDLADKMNASVTSFPW